MMADIPALVKGLRQLLGLTQKQFARKLGVSFSGKPLVWFRISNRPGIGIPKFRGKLNFHPNLCYHATCVKDWLRNDDRLGAFSRSKRLKKTFWGRCSQGCRIISDKE